MTTTTSAARPATARQRAFLASLAAERGVAVPEVATTRQASAAIDALLATPRPRTATATARGRLTTDIPAGRFAVPSRTGNNDLDFFQVDRPTEGRWAGWVFVRRIIGGHDAVSIRGAEAAAALAAVERFGWQNAAALFGQEIGTCSRCGRSLTDAVSRFAGLGPDCRDAAGVGTTPQMRADAAAWAASNGFAEAAAVA